MQTWIKVAAFIFLYILFYSIFTGVITAPNEGDSLGYHIPIAQTVLTGEFLHPHYKFLYEHKYAWDRMYFPAASELILALFIFLHVPLNLYNVLAWVGLLVSGYLLAWSHKLDSRFALIFAFTICTLNTVLRWLNSQTVDIWLAVFFMLSLTLLQKPKDTIFYFVKLGFVLGMLFGTKYSGSSFAVVLLILYGFSLLKYINLQKFIGFTIPFFLLGIFWYIRNYLATGNPIYPQRFLIFKGNQFSGIQVWQAFLHYPTDTFNSLILEFRVWSLVLLIPFLYLIYVILKKNKVTNLPIKLIYLAVTNFILFLFFPSAPENNIHISNYRLAYPVFIPLILFVFIFAKVKDRVEELTTISIANMVMLPPMQIYPKLIFIYIPIAIGLFKTRIFSKFFK